MSSNLKDAHFTTQGNSIHSEEIGKTATVDAFLHPDPAIADCVDWASGECWAAQGS